MWMFCRRSGTCRSQSVGGVVAYRRWVFLFPVTATTMIRFRVQQESFIAIQAAKMILDVVVPKGTCREFVERDGDQRVAGDDFYDSSIRRRADGFSAAGGFHASPLTGLATTLKRAIYVVIGEFDRTAGTRAGGRSYKRFVT